LVRDCGGRNGAGGVENLDLVKAVHQAAIVQQLETQYPQPLSVSQAML
jgi:hypothetical protein